MSEFGHELVLPSYTPTDAVVTFGYSSRDNGNGTVTPSVLSRLALDGAYHHAQLIEAADDEAVLPHIVIAAEQTYPHIPESTGEALIRSALGRTNFGIVPDFDDNRQLSTRLQVLALRKWLGMRREEKPDYTIDVVAFGFHLPRLLRTLDREGLKPQRAVSVENLIDSYLMYLRESGMVSPTFFQENYGVDAEWEYFKHRSLRPFYRTERLVNLIDLHFGSRLLDFMTRHSSVGRIDDVNEKGKAIQRRPKIDWGSFVPRRSEG